MFNCNVNITSPEVYDCVPSGRKHRNILSSILLILANNHRRESFGALKFVQGLTLS